MTAEKNSNWKGGIEISLNGYKWVICREHPKNHKGKIAEHRLVMEKYLGRILESNELVHHKNKNKLDNRIENLFLTTRKEHPSLHKK